MCCQGFARITGGTTSPTVQLLPSHLARQDWQAKLWSDKAASVPDSRGAEPIEVPGSSDHSRHEEETELFYTVTVTAVFRFDVASNCCFKQEAKMQKEVSCFGVSCWTNPDGKDGESGAAEGQAGADDDHVQEEAELKEAVSF